MKTTVRCFPLLKEKNPHHYNEIMWIEVMCVFCSITYENIIEHKQKHI